MPVSVDCSDGITRGMTICDARPTRPEGEYHTLVLLDADEKKFLEYLVEGRAYAGRASGRLKKVKLREAFVGEKGPEVSTTAEDTRLALARASGRESPRFKQAMTEPIWESPAPMVSAWTACTGGTFLVCCPSK